jgi:hypothetical protein
MDTKSSYFFTMADNMFFAGKAPLGLCSIAGPFPHFA